MQVRAHILSPSVARGIAVICARVFVTSASTAVAAGGVGAFREVDQPGWAGSSWRAADVDDICRQATHA
jgi:hypothetical protein